MRSITCLLVLIPLAATAQTPPASPSALAERLAGMTAVTGYERAMGDSLLTALPESTRDRAGNVVLRIGTGTPARLVACPLDEPGFVVGGIGRDGYLTLHRVGGRVPPLFDQQLEGQRVTIWGRRGGVPAVAGVRSTHLTRGRPAVDEPFTADNAYIDLGAASAEQVAALGVGMLSPVALAKRPHRYGDSLLAAPWAGRRAACAAVVSAARAARPGTGSIVVALVVEQNLSARGLRTAANQHGPFVATLIADGAAGAFGALAESPDTAFARTAPELGAVSRIALPTRYGGTPVETVSLGDVTALTERVAAWMGGAR